jgi:hypothetical protein
MLSQAQSDVAKVKSRGTLFTARTRPACSHFRAGQDRCMTAILLALVLFVISFGDADGSTYEMRQFTCPIDSTKFEDGVQTSSYSSGQMLDLEPLGAILAPDPLPVCPKDHFVIYADSIPAEDLVKLRRFVLSSEYQDQVKGNSPYFLLAKLMEHLAAAPRAIGYLYLQASWEMPADSTKHAEYVERSLTAFLQAIPHWAGGWEDSLGVEMLCAELQRQLGRFTQAHERLQQIMDDRRSPEYLTRIAQYEQELIAQRDSLRHEIPEWGRH